MTSDEEDKAGCVKLAFEREAVVLNLDQIVPLKAMPAGMTESKKYLQIVSSMKAIGLVEAPVVAPDQQHQGRYFLLDGHLRLEALKELGINEIECLVSTDDEAYTYNKRVNRLAAIQEHRMITKAVERGVPEERIAEALGLDVTSIRRRFRMLDGISIDVVELLKDTPCPLKVFDFLRRMVPIRQVEAAELMIGQNNFTAVFAKVLFCATPERQLVDPRKKKSTGTTTLISEQIARMERELTSLQSQVKMVEDNYGIDNLHLTVAKGYLAKLLANVRIVRWLTQSRQEYLTEFQTIAEIESIGSVKTAI